MSITPAGGWTDPPHHSEEVQPTVSALLCCPKCQSTDWKSASMVHRDGLSVTNSRTRGTVVGVGRVGLRNGKSAIGGGVYHGQTTGSQQTALSAMAAPPQMRTGFLVFLGIIFIFMGLAAFASFTSNHFLEGSYQISIGCISLVILLALYGRRREIYDHAIKSYANTRMCQRCGTLYLSIPNSKPNLKAFRGSPLSTMLYLFILFLVGSIAASIIRKPEPIIETRSTSPSAPSVSPEDLQTVTPTNTTENENDNTPVSQTEFSSLEQPVSTSCVGDAAHKLSPGAITQLNEECYLLFQKSHTQLAIVIINTLNGEDVTDYAKRLFRKWGIGNATSDRDVIVLIAVQDRRLRIQVSPGLEELLTNGKAADIIEKMRPKLRADEFDAATLLAVEEIEQATISDPLQHPPAPIERQPPVQ